MLYTPILSDSSPVHGTRATVICNAGYSLRNHYIETNVICLDKIWVPSLPVCIKVKLCSSPRKPENGKVSMTGLTKGSKAHYTYHKGYRLSGRRERTCNGRFWDGRRPRCQPLYCPIPKYVENGVYVPCRHMQYTNTCGTFNKPLEGYCVKLRRNEGYLPSHKSYRASYQPRWESNWKIPQGSIVCSDGKWIGFVNNKCDLTVKLSSVKDYWNKKQGLLKLWKNGKWRIASSPPNTRKFKLSCTSVGIPSWTYLRYTVLKLRRWRYYGDANPRHTFTSKSVIKVTCSKLRLTNPKPTPYEGRIEVYNNGNWEGVCVTPTGSSAVSSEICDTLDFNYPPSVISISIGWTDHRVICSQ